MWTAMESSAFVPWTKQHVRSCGPEMFVARHGQFMHGFESEQYSQYK